MSIIWKSEICKGSSSIVEYFQRIPWWSISKIYLKGRLQSFTWQSVFEYSLGGASSEVHNLQHIIKYFQRFTWWNSRQSSECSIFSGWHGETLSAVILVSRSSIINPSSRRCVPFAQVNSKTIQRIFHKVSTNRRSDSWGKFRCIIR